MKNSSCSRYWTSQLNGSNLFCCKKEKTWKQVFICGWNEFAGLSSRPQHSPDLVFLFKTKRSQVDDVSNLFSSAVESIQANEKQSQDLQVSLINDLVQKLQARWTI